MTAPWTDPEQDLQIDDAIGIVGRKLLVGAGSDTVRFAIVDPAVGYPVFIHLGTEELNVLAAEVLRIREEKDI